MTDDSKAISAEAENPLKIKAILWIPAVAIMATIFYLSSRSHVPGPSWIPDYVAHFIAYSFLAAAYYYPLQKTHGSGMKTIFIVLALTSLYGLSDEIHQSFVPGRMSSVKDWAVDSLAGLVVPLVWNKIAGSKID